MKIYMFIDSTHADPSVPFSVLPSFLDAIPGASQ